jgi:CheY-like chemotaxis protein
MGGRQALELVKGHRYDVVATDLRMPDINGHRLSIELLAKPNRPVIIVITGVLEERLERDLRARGVDEIFFKPVDYTHVASQARTLIEARAAANKPRQLAAETSPAVSATNDSGHRPSPSVQAVVVPLDGTSATEAAPISLTPANEQALRGASVEAGVIAELNVAIAKNPGLAAQLIRDINVTGLRPKEQNSRLQSTNQHSSEVTAPLLMPSLAFAVGTFIGWLAATWMR